MPTGAIGNIYKSAYTPMRTHIEKVKNEAPIVLAVSSLNMLVTCRRTMEVFPTPKGKNSGKVFRVKCGQVLLKMLSSTFRSNGNYLRFYCPGHLVARRELPKLDTATRYGYCINPGVYCAMYQPV